MKYEIEKAKKILIGKEIRYSGFCGEVEKATVIKMISYDKDRKVYSVETNHKEKLYQEVCIYEKDIDSFIEKQKSFIDKIKWKFFIWHIKRS